MSGIFTSYKKTIKNFRTKLPLSHFLERVRQLKGKNESILKVMSKPVVVRVISDLVCPWCFVGRKNLEKAVLDSKVPITIQWQPYFLDPNAPPEGEDLMEHLKAKYGPEMVARFSAPGNPLEVAGDKVGIKFNSSRRFINTIDGHRLMEWCNKTHPDKADALMGSLFQAYFVDARDLSKKDQLVQIAQSVGLDGDVVAEFLPTDKYREDVLQSFQKSRTQLRVSGVPYFIIEDNNGGRPTAFSGAQPADVIAEVLVAAQG